MKTFWATLLSVAVIPMAWCCDVCGCAGMMTGFGDLSLYPQNTIGLSYLSRSFESSLGNRDHFTQLDISGRYVISPRWSVQATLPYLWGVRTRNEEDPTLISGLGDASIGTRFTALYSGSEESSRRLTLGAGVFLPTGRFEDRFGSLIPQNFQLGSGSWDYLLEGRYLHSEGDWVGMLEGRYVINTLNREAYKFGNQLGVQLTLAHKLGFKKWALVPLLSVAWEHFKRDINSRGYYQYGTGGEAFTASTGLQIKTASWLCSLRGGTNLTNGSGNYRPGPQLNFSVNYLFNSTKK